ncbi:hypothetical protein SAMN04488103_102431 [Gemmobacter aquatilis]|uniref:Uncharacterized protein n=1 Tax=Gemmobacter aquatilis TaxID=933059 RepID=A0A1H8CBM3_9RHOB|nr:hypothetical protein [Gemmobacter aquatilis]SEM91507.1 hypothetical protein SAMN04488103_102431 [Gemmobacter aquatilis]
MTRVQALRQLVFTSKKACQFLDRDRPDETLKDALNNSSQLVGVLMRGARLTIEEVNRLVDSMRTREGWVGATMNDVEAVRMMARH